MFGAALYFPLLWYASQHHIVACRLYSTSNETNTYSNSSSFLESMHAERRCSMMTRIAYVRKFLLSSSCRTKIGAQIVTISKSRAESIFHYDFIIPHSAYYVRNKFTCRSYTPCFHTRIVWLSDEFPLFFNVSWALYFFLTAKPFVLIAYTTNNGQYEHFACNGRFSAWYANKNNQK